MSGGASSRTKRMRTSFKHHQLRTMKSYFAINHNPDAKDLKQLSQKTGLPKRVLQVSIRWTVSEHYHRLPTGHSHAIVTLALCVRRERAQLHNFHNSCSCCCCDNEMSGWVVSGVISLDFSVCNGKKMFYSSKFHLYFVFIQVWFQNARAKWRRVMLKQEGKSIDGEKGEGSIDLDTYNPHSPSYMLGQASPTSME